MIDGVGAAVVLTYPDHSLTVEAARWLFPRFGKRIHTVCRKGRIDVVRCAVARDLLAEYPKIDWWLWMDRRARPSARSDAILDAVGDVVACDVLGERKDQPPWQIHMDLVRIATPVLKALMSPDAGGKHIPVWKITTTADGTAEVDCECSWFSVRAREGGFTVVRAGVVEIKAPQPERVLFAPVKKWG